MAASLAKYMLGFFVVSAILWSIIKFGSGLFKWILSRVMKASVSFRVGGCNCLRDVAVKFNKGAVESIFISEIRLSIRQSLVKLGAGLISRDPKLQLSICGLKVVMRASSKSSKKTSSKRTRSRKSRKLGRGKWMVVANIARFLSVSMTETVVKTPKAGLEVKEMTLDISKDSGSEPALYVKLHVTSILVHLCESQISSGQSSMHSGSFPANRAILTMAERTSAPFGCEEVSLLCEFGHDREAGVVVRNVDIRNGEISVNLNEELLLKKKSVDTSHVAIKPINESGTTEKTEKKPAAFAVMREKYASMFPEKLSFTLPKVDVKFVHRVEGFMVENSIMGIHLKGSKTQSIEDVGESTQLHVQLEISEIHLLKDAGTSIVEISKLETIASVYIPLEPSSPIRSEIGVKLGGTRCNLIITRLNPWMRLHASKKKKMVLREESSTREKPKSSDHKAIMWTATISAPEMTIMVYDLNGLPLCHACSQSLHVFSNNTSSAGAVMQTEIVEFNLNMSDEHQECMKDLFGVEKNISSLIHIAKVSLDMGRKDLDSLEEGLNCKKVLSVDVPGMGIYLTYRRLASLISAAFSFKRFLKSFSVSGKKPNTQGTKSSKPSGKGIQEIKFNLQQCSLNIIGEVGLENAVVPDPKRVNYGSQGGRIVISVSADGTPRTANIISTASDKLEKVKYSVSLDIFHLKFCMNKEKQSTQVELERAKSIFQEHLEDRNLGTKVTLLDMQNTKFVKRSGGLKEIATCSLFSARDISVRWEPDAHIALFELGLQLKLLMHNQKLQEPAKEGDLKNNEQGKETSKESLQLEKQHKKRESVFALDVEVLNISAEVGDGVETAVQVQSIFSENARIGMLLEGIMLNFNNARLFRSSRMQISRIPNPSSSAPNEKTENGTTWDWVIQALDVHICMPYRLQLRAIDDSVEEMIRALKLVTAAKTKLMFPNKEEKPEAKKTSSTKIGRVRFCIKKLTADIEEEPIQGWLEEHYQLWKNGACESAVRLNFLDELISKGGKCEGSAEGNDPLDDGKININGEEIDVEDTSAIQKLREEIYKQSFRSYYQACKKLVLAEGSGACNEGFQAGFKLSTARTSLFSISATELDVSLTKIEGGDAGMIELLQKLDPVCRAHSIPFSRLYGSNINLRTGSLVVRIRNYTSPLLAANSGRCEGRLVMAQQATPFQPQMQQNVFIGRWRKVRLLRSVSGTTPPMKTYLDLPLHFQKAEISYGVGFEPALTDLSYAFTVALRRANLSIRNPNPDPPPPKKEKSLPWWDEMRHYIHGSSTLYFDESQVNILSSTDPYEKSNKLQIASGYMEIQQADGRIFAFAKDFKILLSSLDSLSRNTDLKHPTGFSCTFLEAPAFSVEVFMEWDCDSGNPLNHYLFALPNEGVPREKVYDPFRSTFLSLRWNLLLRPSLPFHDNQSEVPSADNQGLSSTAAFGAQKKDTGAVNSPTIQVGPHDLAWLIKFWNLNYIPPQKLRTFSRWPRFGVPRIPRSGNLSLDRVMTEFMFRIDSTPTCIKHMPLYDDDPAKGLAFTMTKLKFEIYLGRGKQKYTFESVRDPLELVYQGIDLHIPKAFISRDDSISVAKVVQKARKESQTAVLDMSANDKPGSMSGSMDRHQDDGFLLSSEYFTIRKQSPKADPERLLAWQEAGRRNIETTCVKSEVDNESESEDRTRSDPSDDDGYNVVIADNCQRIFVYGLKILWTLEIRDAVRSWVAGLSKAFEPSKPSPSRQYAQRKLLEESKVINSIESHEDDNQKSPPSQDAGPSRSQDAGPSRSQDDNNKSPLEQAGPPKSQLEPPTSNAVKADTPQSSSTEKLGVTEDSEGEGTRHFMVNVIEPQFNLHSEDANGRFLLAAVSGRVLARSFHSVISIGYEVIEQALGGGGVQIPESQPQMTWNRMELSVMLEQVQAHVAPTDVDPGAGVQWLPKIRRSSPKVKRTGALLERVFMPCDMYFRYTRHKGGTTQLKVKPLKELSFNSHNITAAMTSRQFQVMLDVLTNLLLARAPKPRKVSFSYSEGDDEDDEEEADEVVPDGVEEVELARVELEREERVQKLIQEDIRKLSLSTDVSADMGPVKEGDLWIISGGRSILVQKLKKELVNAKKSRKVASASLRMALQKAAQLRLMEKEKNKSPSCAMRISLQINKVVWSMLVDGKSFAEAEINDMIYDFDRDYKDIGIAKFTIKYFVVRNCLPNAKSDMLLSAWNPPPEWGKKVMVRVDAKQGAPKDGNSTIELLQVEIYPLKIHLTESMYRMMWAYFFPEDEQDSQRRQEVWKVSTTAGAKRAKKGSVQEAPASSSHLTKDSQSSSYGDLSLASKVQNQKANVIAVTPKLRRTSSFDRNWEENVAESVANELVLQMHSSSVSSSKSGPLASIEQPDEANRSKSKESKLVKSGRSSHEEKKVGKAHDEKKSRPRRMREFHNIKISQVELQITYEGSRFAVGDMRLLMDTFHRVEFTGTWQRLFSRVKKHIIWGVLKSVTGMQGKKFKANNQKEASAAGVADIDLNLSDSDGGSAEKSEQNLLSWPKRPTDGAGDGFVTSVKGLFNSQRKKAKAFVLRTMRGEEDDLHGDWSEGEAEFSPFARQLTITKAKKLIRRHTKKFRPRGAKGLSSQQESLPSSPRENAPSESDSSSETSPYEHE
ncbi:protein SABRE-like isoform X1 [Nicotiana tomentosiformis]|uniref:protein SABRE-like isoform X1 n=1 Tax=Nicotiana tomentosiformis TaxID=4098 RepID=UPI00051B554D|nr:protein SABRE-like isoform X1 [Nicotiana tomentosiformis]